MRALFILMVLLVSCDSKVSREDLNKLNGYWEIEKVTFADGSTKDFVPGITIDYIELEGMKGFRKKVQPKFNGTFETSNDAELFIIEKNGERFDLKYNSSSGVRKEHIKSITENTFSVTNQDSLTYSYKKYEPMNLN